MLKPQNYDQEIAFTGDFKVLPVGGHICKIMSAKVELTKTGKEALIIMFDVAEGEAKGFYEDQYKQKFLSNPDAKWQGVYRQLTSDNSLKFFKGMITAIEQSNSGYKWNWDESTLKGKLFGAIMGQEEYQNNNGEIKLSTKCRFIRSVEHVRNGVEVPPVKKLTVSNDNYGFADEPTPWDN